MGRNAQTRKVDAQAAKLEKGTTRRTPPAESKTVARLRRKMTLVRTLAQFEEILYAAHEDSRPSMRRLLEPMLKPELPCCGMAILSRRLGEDPIRHATLCPEARLVKLVH